MAVKLLFFIPALICTAGIAILSLINLAETPVGGLGVSDKVMHAGAYFVLALLWLLFYVINYNTGRLTRKICYICLGIAAFGIFIEVLQGGLTSYRELDVLDMLANTLGVAVAGVLVWSTRKILIGLKPKISLFFLKK